MVEIETIASQGAPLRRAAPDRPRNDATGFHRLIDGSAERQARREADDRGGGAQAGRGIRGDTTRGPSDAAFVPASVPEDPEKLTGDAPGTADGHLETDRRSPSRSLDEDVDAAVRSLIEVPQSDRATTAVDPPIEAVSPNPARRPGTAVRDSSEIGEQPENPSTRGAETLPPVTSRLNSGADAVQGAVPDGATPTGRPGGATITSAPSFPREEAGEGKNRQAPAASGAEGRGAASKPDAIRSERGGPGFGPALVLGIPASGRSSASPSPVQTGGASGIDDIFPRGSDPALPHGSHAARVPPQKGDALVREDSTATNRGDAPARGSAAAEGFQIRSSMFTVETPLAGRSVAEALDKAGSASHPVTGPATGMIPPPETARTGRRGDIFGADRFIAQHSSRTPEQANARMRSAGSIPYGLPSRADSGSPVERTLGGPMAAVAGGQVTGHLLRTGGQASTVEKDGSTVGTVPLGTEPSSRIDPAPAPGQSTPQSAGAPRAAPVQIALAVAAAPPGTSSIELSLAPEELGRVTITLSRSDGGLSVLVLAERDDTMAMLRRHGEQLRDAFAALDQGSVDVSFGGGGTGQGRQPEAARIATDPWAPAPGDLAFPEKAIDRSAIVLGRLDLRM